MQRKPPEKIEKDKKITFYSKDALHCPVCDTTYHREELFSGRVNAEELDEELHRRYKPLAAYGEVYPLVYELDVCPSCYFTAFRGDFPVTPTPVADKLRDLIESRIGEAQKVFSPLDFQAPRRILEGAASYYLAMLCYEHFPPEFAPTIKCGMSALRAAWLCKDLHAKKSDENWDYMSGIFYRKARVLYRAAIELEQNGKEAYSSVRNLGPDTDKNYGHEGVLYTMAILELKYGPKAEAERRKKYLGASKIAIARLFGIGKKTKSKPGPLLELARKLYERLRAELKEPAEEEDAQ